MIKQTPAESATERLHLNSIMRNPVFRDSGQAKNKPAWSQGYKTFLMLNSAKLEIYPAH